MRHSCAFRLKVGFLLFCFAWSGAAQAQGNAKGSADLQGYAGSTGGMPVSVNSSTGQLGVSIPVITIPGLDGEGYQLNLSYAPPTPGSEASWVGHGWTLSPGSIERRQNGVADDYQGEIINIAKKPNYSRVTGTLPIGNIEVWSNEVGANASRGAIWDSERGVLPVFSVDVGGFGGNISYLRSAGDGVFSAGFNPTKAAMYSSRAAEPKGSEDPTDAGGNAEKQLKKAVTQGVKWLHKGLGKSLGPKTKRMLAMPVYGNGTTEHRWGFNGNVQVSSFGDVGFKAAGVNIQHVRVASKAVKRKQVTGYMRGGESQTGMDFIQERLGSLDEYDKFIATPVALPDQFAVSAQGLSGSFRAHFAQPGTFEPDSVDHDIKHHGTWGAEWGGSVSPNVSVGATIDLVEGAEAALESLASAGLDLGSTDFNTLRSTRWEAEGESGFGDDRNAPFFAFDGALNMRRAYGDVEAVPHAMQGGQHDQLVSGVDFEGVDSETRLVQSKWVRWNTVRELTASHQHGGEQRFAKRFCNQPLSGPATRFREEMAPDLIGEFQVVNEQGMIYTFGIPVMVRHQVECAFSLPGGAESSDADVLDHKVILAPAPAFGAHFDDPGDESLEDMIQNSDSRIIQGRVVEPAMASSHLLTSIVSPDYVDLTLDGPTEDDLGTWVKFNYEKDFGAFPEGGGEWFRYRTPLWGHHFSEGNIADDRDDMASFSTGEKEVYRLVSIETRTHVAQFHSSPRTDDGRGVGDLDAAATGVSLSEGATHRLDSISLHARSGIGVDDLLQRVHFTYEDDSSRKLAAGVQGDGTACLTLAGVTIESQDVAEAENQDHYAFDYCYPQASELPAPLQSRYGALLEEPAAHSTAAQNPPFSFNASDVWGNPKLTPPSDFDAHHAWFDRRIWSPGDTDWDPAAHALKQVELPGGLTVFPQYEPGEYRFVQDEPACIMVPLRAGTSDANLVLDLDAVYPEGTGLSASEQVEFLDTYFKNRKLYFKMKYSLGDPDLSKYFTGFVPVQAVTLQGAQVVVELDVSLFDGDNLLNVPENERYRTPKRVCLDYVQKFPKVAFGEAEDEGPPDDVEAAAYEFIQRMALGGLAGLEVCLGCCETLYVMESFVRLPLFPGRSKVGGSLRVKRLLVLDEGLDIAGASSDALLTGTEYDYTELDPLSGERVSSGVAANEPRSIYDEYGKFTPLPKQSQNQFERATQGLDKEKQTGPIGESFFPGPQVLYGEVVQRQIHQGETTLGHVVETFHTHREHPTLVTWSDEDRAQLHKVDKTWTFSPVSWAKQELWYAQGFQVENSAMPGRPKGMTSFGGRFDEPDSWYLVSSTAFEYFAPGAPLSVIDRWSLESMEPPRFDELYSIGRKVESHQVVGGVDVDATLQTVPASFLPVVVPSAELPQFSFSSQVEAVHGTTRLLSRPAFVKSVTRTETGKVTRVDNLAFDPITMEPVVRATTDGFTGLAFEHGVPGASDMEWASQRIGYSFPAHRWYPELGGKYRNDRKRLRSGEGLFDGMAIKKMRSDLEGDYLLVCLDGADGYCDRDVMGMFNPGDLVQVLLPAAGGSVNDNHYHVSRVSGNRVYLHRSGLLGAQNWVSQPTSSEADVDVEILSSGLKNELTRGAGSIEVYDEALSVTEALRVEGELDLFIQAMNAARPQGPPQGSGNEFGASSLTGLSAYSDTMKVQEQGCTRVQDLCSLEQFGVWFSGMGCGIGYVVYPFDGENFNMALPTEPGLCEGNNEFVSFNPKISACADRSAVIPIRFNAGEDRGGAFEFDHDLGAIVWRTEDNPCNPVVIFTPCRDLSRKIGVEGVISSTESVLRDDVAFEHLPSGSDPYETGERGRWVEHSSWVAQSEASSLSDADVHHTRQSGILEVYEAMNEDFAEHMVPPHVALDAHPWIRRSRSSLYDRRSHVLETEDALGLHQSREYGALEKRVTWESAGARNSACFFESFELPISGPTTMENVYLGNPSNGQLAMVLASGGVVYSDSRLSLAGFTFGGPSPKEVSGHTGSRCLKLNVVGGSTRRMRLGQVTLDERCVESDGGVEVRFWARTPVNESTGLKALSLPGMFTVRLVERGSTHPGNGLTPAMVSPALSANGSPVSVEVDSLVQTGRWVMMEARLPSALLDKPEGTPMIVELEWSAEGGGAVYIDDVRVKPFNTMMKCNVHDGADFKLLAELDDNHFGTKYQYNRMDELVRIQVETAAGWKTVSEEFQHKRVE